MSVASEIDSVAAAGGGLGGEVGPGAGIEAGGEIGARAGLKATSNYAAAAAESGAAVAVMRGNDW
jgi:hypothetical protein